jgi:hypothetical protein
MAWYQHNRKSLLHAYEEASNEVSAGQTGNGQQIAV